MAGRATSCGRDSVSLRQPAAAAAAGHSGKLRAHDKAEPVKPDRGRDSWLAGLMDAMNEQETRHSSGLKKCLDGQMAKATCGCGGRRQHRSIEVNNGRGEATKAIRDLAKSFQLGLNTYRTYKKFANISM